jgi:hypothetical protein
MNKIINENQIYNMTKYYQLRDQTWRLAGRQMSCQILTQINDQVMLQISNQVKNRIYNQIRSLKNLVKERLLNNE